MKLQDLFDVDYGVDLELNSLVKCKCTDKDSVNFVSRTSRNNGISAVVKIVEGITPIPAGTISVAGGGSVLETNIQLSPYYSGRDLFYLTPKVPMDDNVKLYYCLCIRANKFRYNYGRQANTTLSMLELPSIDEIPTWVHSTRIKDLSFYRQPLNPICPQILDMHNWRSFKVKDLFTVIERGKSHNAQALVSGDDVWYIGAKKRDNGLIKKVKRITSLISPGNCMVLINNGQGSVGYANYMDDEFIGSMDICTAYGPDLDKFVGIFLATMFSANRFRYNFGRKWNGARLLDSEILLPVIMKKPGIPLLNSNFDPIPDYDFMREYVQRLPFTKGLE